MAWSPRRGRRVRRMAAAGSPQAERGGRSAASRDADVAPAEPGRAAPERAVISGPAHGATGREWRRMPALKLTIAPLPRLVGGVAFTAPEVSGTRLLLRPPLGASRTQAIAGFDEGPPPTGKVRGLISVTPAERPVPGAGQHAGPVAQEDGLGALDHGSLNQGSSNQESPHHGSRGLRRALGRDRGAVTRSRGPVEAEPEPTSQNTENPLPPLLVPPRRARPVTRPRTERVSLVDATGPFVGEPQAAETPYTSSAWLRMLQSYLPDAPGSPIPGMSAPGLTETVKPDGGTVRSWSSSAIAEPPRLPTVSDRGSADRGNAERDRAQGGAGTAATSQVPVRRANLAESRRLGLGAPLTHPRPRTLEATASDADEDDDAEAAGVETRRSEPPIHQPTPRAVATSPVAAPRIGPLTFIADERALPTTPAAPKPAAPKPAGPKPGSPVYRAAASAPALGTARPPAGPHRDGPARSVTGELVHRPPASPTSRATETKDAPRPTRPGETENGWTGLTAPPPPRSADAPIQFAPPELAETLRRLHGVDVSNVPIRRDSEAAERAHSLGARAFTHDGEVFLPQSEGSLDQPQTRALLAHELTHAAQHRLLGTALPDESSAAGHALEAAAVAAEQWTLGRTLHPGSAEPAAPVAPAPGRVMRAADPPPALHQPAGYAATIASAAPLLDAHGPYGRQDQDSAYTLPPAAVHRVGTSVARIPGATGEPMHPDLDRFTPADAAQTSSNAESAALSGRLARLARQRPLDLDDAAAVDELADDLYRRFHSRLRRELLIDRERSGVLGDFG